MALEAIIAILISGVALAVSALSLYFSLFHKKVALIGSLAAYKTHSHDDALMSEFEFSLANTGNRELLVQQAAIEVVGSSGGNLVPELEPTEIPTVLKAGEIKLVILRVPRRFLENIARDEKDVQFEFHIFAPGGQLHSTTKRLNLIFEEGEVSDDDHAALEGEDNWKPFKLGRRVK